MNNLIIYFYLMQPIIKKPENIHTKQQFYSQNQIIALREELQERHGFELDFLKVKESEIAVLCKKTKDNHCGYAYLFRVVEDEKQSSQFRLISHFDLHHPKCISQKTKEQSLQDEEELEEDHEQLKSTKKSTKSKAIDESGPNKYFTSPTKTAISHELEEIKQLKDLYTEDELPALKKLFEYQSKGLVSRTTEFHSKVGYITQIKFRCKSNEQCPYSMVFEYTYKRNANDKKLYKLERICGSHHQNCTLTEEETNMLEIEMLIDEHQDFFLQLLHHDPKIRPKEILEQLATKVGQNAAEFIYRGFERKIFKRAVKKYFDNAIGKARLLMKECIRK